MGDLQTWAGIGIVAGAILTSLTLVTLVARPIRKLARMNEEFREDWYGSPARPGRDAVPGVPERLSRIESELKTNGGTTMRDALVRIETRLDDHIRNHTESK